MGGGTNNTSKESINGTELIQVFCHIMIIKVNKVIHLFIIDDFTSNIRVPEL